MGSFRLFQAARLSRSVAAPFALALTCAVVLGCDASSSSDRPSAPVGSAAAVGVTIAPTATARPTPDQETIRKLAAARYLSVAEKANKDAAALDKKYPTFKTLKQARAYYKAEAKIEGTFVAAVKTLAVPTDTAADLHSVVAKRTAVQAHAIEGSGAKSWAH